MNHTSAQMVAVKILLVRGTVAVTKDISKRTLMHMSMFVKVIIKNCVLMTLPSSRYNFDIIITIIIKNISE